MTLAASPVTSLLAHSANEPVPRGDQGWRTRHELLNRRAAEAGDKAQVIFIGDSITQGWEGAGKDVWEQYYAKRNTVNLGIGGDRTQHVLWRLDNGNLDGLKPKAAVVMIGTNNSNGEDNTPGQIVEGVTAIVKKLREKLPDTKVLLVAIFPRSENFTAQRGKILQVNQVLRRLADDKNVFWIDFGHQFVNSDGLIPADLMPDYLHLTKAGYALWAEELEGKLSSILGDDALTSLTNLLNHLTGEWTSSVQGDDGQTFDSRLIFATENGKLVGKISRDEDRWLEIQNAEIKGNELSWMVKRDRRDGSIATYQVSGKVENGVIRGVVKGNLDGQERTFDWTARKK